jgi:uncharacterized protein (TIGR00661 family)
MIRRLDEVVRETRPDVILNFFEPVAAWFAITRRRRPPVVAIGHQFMFLHPDYPRHRHLRRPRLALDCYARMLGARSTRLALSLYPAPDRPRQRLLVGPPILRRQLFDLTPNPDGKFVLVYLLNHGYAEQVIRWSAQNPGTRLHCFYDKPGAPEEFQHSPSLWFHRLDGEKFLAMMADCRHVVCTAGFESVSEAAWLGKPMFLVPVENHSEQQLNALDAERCGFGLAGSAFNLDRLVELPGTLPTESIRAWIRRAPEPLLAAIEAAAETGSRA